VSSVTERRLQANGLTFNLAEAGSGPPVLLLHGFPDCWRLWRHQLAALAGAGHRVIAPDLRSFGETDKPGEVGDYKMRTVPDASAGGLMGDPERSWAAWARSRSRLPRPV
jgi:pimeloyl-ACP methyl ester carboxylesterase